MKLLVKIAQLLDLSSYKVIDPQATSPKSLAEYSKDEMVSLLRTNVEEWNRLREKWPDVAPDLIEADLAKADLRGVNLSKAKLNSADLTEANMTDSNLKGADLGGFELMQGGVTLAIIGGANLTRATLRRSVLDGARLNGASLVEADLTQATLKNATLVGDGFSADFHSATLTGVKFTNERNAKPQRKFLDLALVDGIESVDFGDSDFLPRYLERVINFAGSEDLVEVRYIYTGDSFSYVNDPEDLFGLLEKIRALHSIFSS